jgi:hypothetical protein
LRKAQQRQQVLDVRAVEELQTAELCMSGRPRSRMTKSGFFASKSRTVEPLAELQ